MFPEYREQIAQLRANDRHFSRLFDEHNKLDHEVKQLEDKRSPAFHAEIDRLKKQKLALKEEIYSLLRKEDASAL
ncbi:YdcH family protein [Comamonas sp. NoAH]|uniref:YdcH family protein n=1 Tax=Comamonas halotolerans TaxID=3041496 RepID=UPI0024E125DD|nr:YdcH family protein [Comamonas sp. NoAH]